MQICAEPGGWSDNRAWNTAHSGTVSNWRSDTFANTQWPGGNTITLTAGQPHYMLAIHHDHSWSGGDWFGATYQGPGDAAPNRVGGADFKIAGDTVQPLPSDFKGVKGEITPDLGYVLAAPIRRKDEVWGVIDLDAASDDGTRILKQAAAQDVLCRVAKNLSNLLAP